MEKIRKFRTIASFFGVTSVVLIFLIAVAAFLFTHNVKQKVFYRQRFTLFEARNKNINAISFGNSTTSGLLFRPLGLDGVHLWYPEMDLEEMFAVMRYVLDKAPKLKYVFLSLSYGQLYQNNRGCGFARITELQRYRIKFYQYWRFSFMIPGDIKNYILSVLDLYIQKKQIQSYYDPNFIVNDFGEDLNKAEFNQNGQIIISRNIEERIGDKGEQLVDESLEYLNKQINRFIAEIRSCRPKAFYENIELLRKIVRMVRERNLRLIFFRPPIIKGFRKYLVEHIAGAESELLEEYARNDKQICYVDLQSENFFQEERGLFESPNHLNASGAKKASVFFQKCLTNE